jgi:hypothetical protein
MLDFLNRKPPAARDDELADGGQVDLDPAELARGLALGILDLHREKIGLGLDHHHKEAKRLQGEIDEIERRTKDEVEKRRSSLAEHRIAILSWESAAEALESAISGAEKSPDLTKPGVQASLAAATISEHAA